MRTSFREFTHFTRTSRKTCFDLAEVRGSLSMAIKAPIGLSRRTVIRGAPSQRNSFTREKSLHNMPLSTLSTPPAIMAVFAGALYDFIHCHSDTQSSNLSSLRPQSRGAERHLNSLQYMLQLGCSSEYADMRWATEVIRYRRKKVFSLCLVF